MAFEGKIKASAATGNTVEQKSHPRESSTWKSMGTGFMLAGRSCWESDSVFQGHLAACSHPSGVREHLFSHTFRLTPFLSTQWDPSFPEYLDYPHFPSPHPALFSISLFLPLLIKNYFHIILLIPLFLPVCITVTCCGKNKLIKH